MLIATIRHDLAKAGDPAKAPQMQAYMKSAMPYHGVQTPTLRALCKTVFAAHPLPSRPAWLATVRGMWREATHREERYAAIALTGDRAYRSYQDVDLVSDIYEEMIVTGAWWDYVDEVAIRRIGPILRAAHHRNSYVRLGPSGQSLETTARKALAGRFASTPSTTRSGCRHSWQAGNRC